MTKQAYIDALIEAKKTNKPLDNQLVATDVKTTDEAYAIAWQVAEMQNESVIGYKIAAATPEGMAAFGVTEPIYGVLVNKPVSTIKLQDMNEPKAEIELVFLVKEDLDPNEEMETLVAKLQVCPGLEIPDSRYQDWAGKLSAVQFIADYASASQFVVSDPIPFTHDLLGQTIAELFLDDQSLGKGHSTAVMGHPINPVIWLVKKLNEQGKLVKKGQYISTGSFIPPIPLVKGQYKGVFLGIGEVSLKVE